MDFSEGMDGRRRMEWNGIWKEGLIDFIEDMKEMKKNEEEEWNGTQIMESMEWNGIRTFIFII